MTAAILRLPDRRVLVVSVYVPKEDSQALRGACDDLRNIITNTRRNAGTTVDVVIAGDFNRHDQLWGGDDVSVERQGEADRIIDLMNEFALCSLLRRGTKTWHGGDYDTTIDLVPASTKLADTTVKCTIYRIEYGSDHCAIETVFNTLVLVPKQRDRLLLKNVPWKETNTRIAKALDATPSRGTI